jgi:pimeloyl-ACP methyl ester carboxylesterase
MNSVEMIAQSIADAPEGRMGKLKMVDVKGVTTAYHDTGQGETILFVFGGHFGSGGNSTHSWDHNFGPLSRRHRVVAVDRLGQGYTAPPLSDEDYTMAAVVEHIANFIRVMKLPPVHIVGHSRGGYAVTRLTLLYPELVKSLTIVCSGTLSPRAALNEVALGGAPPAKTGRDHARWVMQHFSHDPDVVTEEILDRVTEVQQLPHWRQTVRDITERNLMSRYFVPGLGRDKRETHIWLAQGRLQRPTQIMWALNDPTVSPDGAYDLFDTIRKHNRHVELMMFNKSGHMAFWEYPEHFNAQLAGFVDQVSCNHV